jgi:esterase/lipase/1-acyl-sn-glycerol-3-phosphate acyltransferase
MTGIAYRTTELVIQALTNLSRARVRLHNAESIPEAPAIFVINHFTRLETVLMPYLIYRLTRVPVRILADAEFFGEPFGKLLDHLGAVSTRDPDRDRLIVKTLLKGDTHWIIFPEGGMVKTMKIMEGRRFMVTRSGIKRPPHTGPATLGLQAEFYRARLKCCCSQFPEECSRLLKHFQLDALPGRIAAATHIVPVNITYYPVRARENALIDIARRLSNGLPERLVEELMTEGSMVLSGVDVDVRFGEPIPFEESLGRLTTPTVLCGAMPADFDSVLVPRKAVSREAVRVMSRYMSSIYGMTTVNPDHILASLLRSTPYRQVDRDDLARRLFLVATDLLGRNVYLHPELAENPLHLLTDDPRGIVRDFLALAVEKGYLLKEGAFYRKGRSSFGAAHSFHRARIDNPLDGMANAIEPLFEVRRRMGRTALYPAAVVSRLVRRRLMREAVEEFVEDYRHFSIPGESKPSGVGMPFLVRGRTRRIGVVLAHGYLAAPLEVKGLADYLGSRGFWVYVPRLRGHGTSPEDLAERTHKDWAACLDRGYAIMKTLCRRVVAGGFSTGGGLALDLASRVDDLAGVFAISAPLRLRDFSARLAPTIIDAWNRFMDATGRSAGKMAFVENHPENPHINYLRNPVSGVHELGRLMDELDGRLPAIRTPALVIQSERDPVVDPRGSERIFKRLGSPDKTHVRFNFDRHGILLGENSKAVYRAVTEFIEHLSD